MHNLRERIHGCIAKRLHGGSWFNSLALGVHSCCLSYQLNCTINQRSVFASEKVMPFPCLATEERDTTNDRPDQPFDHTFLVAFVTSMHSQHHGNGAKDEDEGHHTHECERKIGVASPGKCIENRVGVGPVVLAEPNGSV